MTDIIPKGITPTILPAEEPMVTPKWLESRGFVRVPSVINWDDLPFRVPANFDVHFEAHELCYIEPKIRRDRFCVVLTPCLYTDGTPWFDFEVYIQDDIGCGFTNMPYRWRELTIKSFSLLYESFRDEKLMPANLIRISTGS